MSKLKAALITMFLGSSTAAMAAPTVSFSANAQVAWGTSYGPTVRDHRTDPVPAPYVMPPSRQTWITVASSLSMASGRDTVSFARNNNISAIRLTAQSGYTYVGRVKVRFLDGATQTINLNQWIPSSGLSLSLNASHRGVDSMVINGSISGRRSMYSVSALSSRSVELPRPPIYTPTYPQIQEQAPVTLESELSFANTNGVRHIYAGANLGTFTKLHLTNRGGQMPLAKVIVSFANGQSQTFDHIDRLFTPGESIDLRLDPRGGGQISELYVYTNDQGTPTGPVIMGSFLVQAQ